ncbi:hypothetical protein LPJ78_000628 [Coemansia sp. RSA 989]|nr:40S ribosomal protein S10-A [Coemansia mojavensis]KAJ1744173.1 hypothetical protein LPJ68_000233 [Coemansia sp. RSA 1086]KAJ1750024.1 hypothetical protein LPJ79_003272 [Coemansia sp. RSA 1821]KAJ1867929.1 hypothetical protein LPJ78_000628 [Coemansia sp. RSA 989]KAJ1874482.1 hypothetical protein LPJ55_001481 [Coemansia sp. RSA 990]KAJ2633399.1 hypothetical protein H4R22_000500 [Coemansia sp. RSA 1290]KAJ2653091.1 hypothetical protein IWW40_000745 [Coemansia sp. RSA 1250]KAJ2676091.1 hypoth
MYIPTENRKAISKALFKEGVLVAKKDYNAARHPEINVPNLQVIKAMQSLTSRGYVKTQFSWQYYYYIITDEGIAYLREYLNLPQDVVPATFKKVARPAAPRFGRSERPGGFRRDDGGYRRRDEGRKEGADNFRPEFRGGFGRGRPQQQ